MKTTLDKLLKACLNTRLEIVRFKTKNPTLRGYAIDNFLEEIYNTLLDMHDDVVELKEELEK